MVKYRTRNGETLPTELIVSPDIAELGKTHFNYNSAPPYDLDVLHSSVRHFSGLENQQLDGQENPKSNNYRDNRLQHDEFSICSGNHHHDQQNNQEHTHPTPNHMLPRSRKSVVNEPRVDIEPRAYPNNLPDFV